MSPRPAEPLEPTLKHRVAIALVVSLTALLLAPGAQATVFTDDASRRAPTYAFTDPTGDYWSFYKKVDAPRASIDILAVTVTATKMNGHRGSRVSIRVKNVLTAAGSKSSYQRFMVFTNDAEDRSVSFRRNDPVVQFVDGVGSVCKNALKSFNTTTDKASVFIPRTCVGGVTSVKADVFLQNNRRAFSRDMTDKFSW